MMGVPPDPKGHQPTKPDWSWPGEQRLPRDFGFASGGAIGVSGGTGYAAANRDGGKKVTAPTPPVTRERRERANDR